jgi:prepilin-type processing-associated H-X9-DG protein
MHAEDHSGRYPDDLQGCLPYCGGQSNLFFCPSSAQTKRGPLRKYVYVTGLSETNTPGTVVAYCPSGSHNGDGGNVLFVDGHVEWFESKSTNGIPSFDQIIRRGTNFWLGGAARLSSPKSSPSNAPREK